MTQAQQILWRPNAGPQTKFLASTASEVLYGGAAGGGKSAASVALPLKWIHNGAFRALFLRREAKYLSDAIDKSRALYPHFGGHLVQSPKTIWRFPSGAQLWLNHCEHEHDVANYDGFEFNLVIFEELTHFTERQYRGIRARIRSTDPTLPLYSRATTNPGGEGAEWVFSRFGAWLNPRHERPAAPNEVRWYRGDEETARGAPDALSRQFIPARLTDNPHIGAEYRAQLMDLDPVRREQLLNGDWLVQPGAGKYFKRAHVKRWLTERPRDIVQLVRAWDLAATVDGDWTVGVLMARLSDGTFAVLDVVRLRGAPAEVKATILATAELDGRAVTIRLPQDPGQAGVDQRANYARMLAGYRVEFERPTGDKITRAGAFSTQWTEGNVACLLGRWADAYVGELEGFPDGSFDDQVDASADAFNFLCGEPMPTKPQRDGVYTSDVETSGIY